jgi:hypothetical protein
VEWGLTAILRGNNPQNRMSALGHKRPFRDFPPMSALPPKADIREQESDVRFVPKADILRRSKIVPFVDHLVGAQPAARAKGH